MKTSQEKIKKTPSLNCWEFMKCGREPSGSNIVDVAVCPASIEEKFNGINSGNNGGRACWAVAGTLCEGVIQITSALKIRTCLECDFYRLVRKEEGSKFKGVLPSFGKEKFHLKDKQTKKCPHLIKWITFTCMAKEKLYFPSPFQIHEYCNRENHKKCPFFLN